MQVTRDWWITKGIFETSVFMNILWRTQLDDAVSCSDYVITGRDWSIAGMLHTERSEMKLFQYRCVHQKLTRIVYYIMPSLHNVQNSCTITTGYIPLHVSAIIMPTRNSIN